MKKRYFTKIWIPVLILIFVVLFVLKVIHKPQNIYLLAYKDKAKTSAATTDKATALEQFKTIAPQIESEKVFGYCDSQYTYSDLEESESIKYALYTATQNHGDAFSVSVHILSIYEANAVEEAILIWYESVPQKTAQYEVLYDKDLLQTSQLFENEQLFFVEHYSIAINAKDIQEQCLTQSGYSCAQSDSIYTKSFVFLVEMDSVFNGAN